MNQLIAHFKACCHQTGDGLRYPNGKLIREFRLGDLLDNSLADGDDAPTIAVKAIVFFCADSDPRQEVFRFAVLAVNLFLHVHHGHLKGQPSTVAMGDLVKLLARKPSETHLREWIKANYG